MGNVGSLHVLAQKLNNKRKVWACMGEIIKLPNKFVVKSGVKK